MSKNNNNTNTITNPTTNNSTTNLVPILATKITNPSKPANRLESSVETTMKFYSLIPIQKFKATYNIIIGERSNGKTYATLHEIVSNFISKGKQGAYIRRWKEDYRGKRGSQMFAALETSGAISNLTDGKYDRVHFYSGKWYLATYDYSLDKIIKSETPFCYAFALNDMEHDKSTSYPDVTTIVFDEFLTRQYYLPDEFVLFMNVLSTIIRHRDDVTIYMLGNTVNKFCPYFKEMGLSHVAEMQEGKIDLYTYGDSPLTVAVERCASPNKEGKPSDKYFAFDNPALAMITGGAWEIQLYPHLPLKYSKSEILFIYFINFNDHLLQCEIIYNGDTTFTYIHEKTTPIQSPATDIIFSEEYSPYPNHYRDITRPHSDLTRKIYSYFVTDKVFYQDNEVGEIVRNFIIYCKKTLV